MGHSHTHSHDNVRELRKTASKRLKIALTINAVFLVIEIVGGLVTNSLALLADAGHMLTDVAALILALVVARLAERAATPERTYGLHRAEVLGALLNGAALVIIVGFIIWEAWKRLGAPSYHVEGAFMLIVAVAGLLANLASAWVLSGSKNTTVNVKGAFLHMAADALGSVGAIVAGIVIITTGWIPIDAIMSLFIGALILFSTWGLLSETLNILLEATPANIDYNEIEQALLEIEHVEDIHDLHIWTISSGIPSLSAHITLVPECSDSSHWHICLKHAQNMLRDKFGIEHTTLQFEPYDFERDNRLI